MFFRIFNAVAFYVNQKIKYKNRLFDANGFDKIKIMLIERKKMSFSYPFFFVVVVVVVLIESNLFSEIDKTLVSSSQKRNFDETMTRICKIMKLIFVDGPSIVQDKFPH